MFWIEESTWSSAISLTSDEPTAMLLQLPSAWLALNHKHGHVSPSLLSNPDEDGEADDHISIWFFFSVRVIFVLFSTDELHWRAKPNFWIWDVEDLFFYFLFKLNFHWWRLLLERRVKALLVGKKPVRLLRAITAFGWLVVGCCVSLCESPPPESPSSAHTLGVAAPLLATFLSDAGRFPPGAGTNIYTFKYSLSWRGDGAKPSACPTPFIWKNKMRILFFILFLILHLHINVYIYFFLSLSQRLSSLNSFLFIAFHLACIYVKIASYRLDSEKWPPTLLCMYTVPV